MLPQPMALGTFIGVGRSLETALQRVKRAEELGYESAYVTHIAGRDSLTLLAAYGQATSTIRVGTGVMPIYSRTPVATAQSAATIDEMTGGRLVLGLGVSHRPIVEGWYGQRIERPGTEMREYVAAVRAMLRGEEPPASERFPTGFRFAGFEPRADLPIYVAALSPRMLRLAGEIADGVILWLCNPEYIREVVVPEVRTGRERAGREPESFDIVAAVPSAVTGEAAHARDHLRQELIPYFSLPFYRAMIERSGFGADIEAFDDAMGSGDPAAAAAKISDAFVELLGAIGTPEEAVASIRRYRDAGATSPCVGGIARTDFDATLDALAGALG